MLVPLAELPPPQAQVTVMLMIVDLAVAGALLAAGAVIGILTVLAAGIRREEKHASLTVDSPGRAASAARAAHGVYARRPGTAQQETSPDRQDTSP